MAFNWSGVREIRLKTAIDLFREGKDVYLLEEDGRKRQAFNEVAIMLHKNKGGKLGVKA